MSQSGGGSPRGGASGRPGDGKRGADGAKRPPQGDAKKFGKPYKGPWKGGDGKAGKQPPKARPVVPPQPPREPIAERRSKNRVRCPSFGTASVASRGEDLGGLKSRMMATAALSARERAGRIAEGLDYGPGDENQFGY